MSLRALAISTVGVVVFVVISAAYAQTPAQPQKDVSPSAIVHAQKAVDKAAAQRKITLSDAARRELAVEVVRQEAAAPNTATPQSVPDAKIDRLFKPIESAKPGGPVDADRVRQVIANDKRLQVQSTLSQEVTTHAAAAGLIVPDDVREMMVEDLKKQTAGLSVSGVPVEAIKSKNELFVRAIAQELHGAPITPFSYAQVRQVLFQRFVTLRIESVPSRARVKMNGTELGVTDLEQSLEPNKLYQFEFALAGYTTALRPYYVTAGASDVLKEPLNPEKPPTLESESPSQPPQRGPVAPPFPWGYVVIGSVVLVSLLFLALRR